MDSPRTPLETGRPTALCLACGRRYDVEGLDPSTVLRCACGATLAACESKPLVVRTLACSHCGGTIDADAARCPWCGGGIALEDRRLSGVCPSCKARCAVDAAFCRSCGTRIAPQALAPIRDGRGCPRCESALRARTVGDHEVVECSSCGGLWLPTAVLDEECRAAERGSIPSELSAPLPSARAVEAHPRYLPCAGCGALMTRRNFGGSSGVVVDVCRFHGVWLDAGELERILEWARTGGVDRERERRIEREKRAAAEAREAERAAKLAPFQGGARDDSDLGDVLVSLFGSLFGSPRRR